jgi:polyhydroxybutyrate depolymerase
MQSYRTQIVFGFLLVSYFLNLSPQRILSQDNRRTWEVKGLQREAMIFVPTTAKETPTPVVFGFHGHGGSMQNVAASYAFQRHWPEAIVVYMQGLKTPGKLTDPEGKRTGWQSGPGDQDDRDLHFFDAVLASLKKEFQVDDSRIYSTGHSNGGGFTYLLWQERGDVFAALAPSASAALRADQSKLKPIPIMHLAGTQDPLVKFAWQELMIARVKQINGCSDRPKPWSSSGKLTGTLYESSKQTPLVTLFHGGGHEFDRDAPALIVKFFKEHSKK